MHLVAILNRDSGTLRTADAGAYCAHLEGLLAAQGHSCECRAVGGAEIITALERAFSDKGIDGVIAAGGDGTLSAAAALAWRAEKILGVIPAGTMNLYARALGMPLEIHAAAEALASGREGRSDIATANGRPFLHQFSVGFHSRLVRSRDDNSYRSRFGKIRASVIAALDAIRRPPSFPVEIVVDGVYRRETVSSLSVSNNPYGEGHLPYADRVDGGELGVYYARPASVAANARMLADLTLGTWRANPDIHELRGRRVDLTFPRRRRSAHAVIDGELIELAGRVQIEIHPQTLKVIRPGPAKDEA